MSSGRVFGAGRSLQVGKETSWGTAVAGSQILNFTSESLKCEVTRKGEDSLMNNKVKVQDYIAQKKVSGDIVLVAKPENLGFILKMMTGGTNTVTGTAAPYTHTFVPVSAGGSLPSFTGIVDRGTAVKKYAGLKVKSVSFDCAQGDALKITMTVDGKDESDGVLASGLEVPVLRAFRFSDGSLSFGGTKVANVYSVKATYDEGSIDGAQTFGGGLYLGESDISERSFKLDIETAYSSAINAYRDSGYLNGATVACELVFVSESLASDDDPYMLTITIPALDITASDANVNGKDEIKLSMSGEAVWNGTDEAITFELQDATSTVY